MIWEQIVDSYMKNPRDVKTNPLTSRPPVWFFVYVENETVYIDRAKWHNPSSEITVPRKLAMRENECDIMFDLYQRRKHGDPVSKEAQKASVNQVYWYGIFADLE